LTPPLLLMLMLLLLLSRVRSQSLRACRAGLCGGRL
jgi:hypothetical protein